MLAMIVVVAVILWVWGIQSAKATEEIIKVEFGENYNPAAAENPVVAGGCMALASIVLTIGALLLIAGILSAVVPVDVLLPKP